jgi:predicted RNA-binding protein with TRAM domain
VTDATKSGTAPVRAPRRGERLEVEIDSLAFGGRGVARADGFVVFVSGGLPGDRVLAEVTKGKKRFAEAFFAFGFFAACFLSGFGFSSAIGSPFGFRRLYPRPEYLNLRGPAGPVW